MSPFIRGQLGPTVEICGVITRTISEAVTPAAAQKLCAVWQTVLEVWQVIPRRVHASRKP